VVRCLERAGIVDVDQTAGRRMHSTRHTYATDLGRATNWNLVAVQKNLGHSSIKLTFDTYSQFSFEDQELAVELLPEIEVADSNRCNIPLESEEQSEKPRPADFVTAARADIVTQAAAA
jgi:integrase